MRITLDQFQTDFVTGLDSVVVGAQWLQDVLKERDKLKRQANENQYKIKKYEERIITLSDRVLELELKDKNIYILDTLA